MSRQEQPGQHDDRRRDVRRGPDEGTVRVGDQQRCLATPGRTSGEAVAPIRERRRDTRRDERRPYTYYNDDDEDEQQRGRGESTN